MPSPNPSHRVCNLLHCNRPTFTFNARGRRLKLGARTAVMGVVNLTPDSFSGDGRLSRRRTSAQHAAFALRMVDDGADLIDIGGQSTRPGAHEVSTAEEIKRVVPTVVLLRKKSEVLISVDTSKEDVAAAVLEAGADIINNVQPASMTSQFLAIIKKYKAGVILMHSRGTPQTMQRHTHYDDLLNDIMTELKRSLENCLSAGIKSDKIILDPGIGFAKTVEQNLKILRQLHHFQSLKHPILVGTSRKSFIGTILNKNASDRLWGTAATVAVSVVNGAHIVRVHDVAVMRETVDMVDAILTASERERNA
jgi:dihydropteroate synthase